MHKKIHGPYFSKKTKKQKKNKWKNLTSIRIYLLKHKKMQHLLERFTNKKKSIINNLPIQLIKYYFNTLFNGGMNNNYEKLW